MSRKHKNKKSDEGQVWSSYSDLFTTVAIIFLTMFVFAMVKVGVTTMEKIAQKKAHEKELQGKISKKAKEKNDQKKEIIKDSLESVAKHKDIINQKVLELNDLVKNLSKNEEVMNDLLKDSQKKEAILEQLNKTLSEKKRELALAASKNDQLQKDLGKNKKQLKENVTKLLKREEEIKKREDELNKVTRALNDEKNKLSRTQERLSNELRESEKQKSELQKKSDREVSRLANMMNENNDKYQDEIHSLKKQHKRELKKFQSESEVINIKAQKKIEKLQSENQVSKKMIAQMNETFKQERESFKRITTSNNLALKKSQEFIKEQRNNIQKLNEQNKKYLSQNNELKSQLNENKGFKKLSEILGKEVNDLQNSLAGQSAEVSQMRGKLARQEAYTSNLEGDFRDLSEKYKSQSKELQKYAFANDRLKNQNNKIKDKINILAQKVQGEKKKLRANIAQKLTDKFRGANIDASVDPKTGTVTLLMDNNLLFETNSSKLNEFAKNKLSKIIPLYSEVLFEDQNIKTKISSFNVEGHSSPSFNQSYVDPSEKNTVAYEYNLNLSARRATSITSYIFGNQIGDFNHKIYMRSISKSIGHGYMNPIIRQAEKSEQEDFSSAYRSLASISSAEEESTCGPYDCELSQRVELSFTLKDDPKVLESLLNMNVGEL